MALTVDQGLEFCSEYGKRREKFPDEEWTVSMMTVLFNFGDHMRKVICVKEEWEGTKAELAPRDGIPLCPNGHPLFEVGPRYVLGIVEETNG